MRQVGGEVITRYTIEGNGTNAFKLVEDKNGAWMQAAEVLAQVPRCDSCKHWSENVIEAHSTGQCLRAREQSSLLWADLHDSIQTTKNFGCVQWEAK